jgi:mevalonate kinase
MPAIFATAPGKAILFGEHAVVYGRPAIAIPVTQVRATAIITPLLLASPGTIKLEAPDIGLSAHFAELPMDHPLAAALYRTFSALEITDPPAMTVRITSTIPVASGLGSGAAVSVALIRALSAFFGHPLPDEEVCALAFEVEKIHHGTPSGIDNTVITYRAPVYFVRGEPIRTVSVPLPFTLVIGDTGVSSPTAVAVGDVRAGWKQNQPAYAARFDAIGDLARIAFQAITAGDIPRLGPLMDQNHTLLTELGVSSPELDRLVNAARNAGAWGAKLSGAGRGGNMIALVPPEMAASVAQAVEAAGAVHTIITKIEN